MNISIIDIGSNSIRMAAYNKQNDLITNTFNKKESVGLVNYISNNVMSEKGIQVLIETLEKFKEIISSFKEEHSLYIFATASLRNLSNKLIVTEKVFSELGYRIEVLSGEEEARYSFLGTVGYRNRDLSERGVVVDIGGGSTEIVVFEGSSICFSCSMDIGALNIYRNFISYLFPSQDEEENIKGNIKSMIVQNSVPDIKCNRLYVVGGSTRTFYKYCKNYCKDYLLNDDESFDISSETLTLLLKYVSMNRYKSFMDNMLIMKPDRVHTVVPGMIILEEIVAHFNSNYIVFSQEGIREGYLYSKIESKEI